MTEAADISPLTEEWFTKTLLPLLPISIQRGAGHIRTIVEQTIEALEVDGGATFWPAGPVRLTLVDQALLGDSVAVIGGITLHRNAAGTVIAIDLPAAPIYVEPLS